MSAAALRIPSHVLRWVLILGPILVLALAFQALWTLRAATARPDPDDMSIVADRVAQLVDAYLARIAGTTSSLVVIPEVVNLAATHSANPFTPKDRLTEASWKGSVNRQDDPFLRLKVKDEPVSAYFRDLTAADGGVYREIFLSDTKGRLIAASNRTEDYLQGDDSWWPADLEDFTDSCRRVPLECVHMTDVDWDESAATVGYDIVLPVVTPDGHAVGVLKAVVDPHELDELLRFAALNSALDVALINEKGMRLPNREPFFDKGEPKEDDLNRPSSRLRGLAPGGETSWPLAENGPSVYVRRLSSHIEKEWSIAVMDRDHDDAGVWKTYVLWCLFTLGMFAIAAGAFAIKAPPLAEAPVEQGVTS